MALFCSNTKFPFCNSRHERDCVTAMERLGNCLNAEFIADASIPDGTKLSGGQKVSDPLMFDGNDSNAGKKEKAGYC